MELNYPLPDTYLNQSVSQRLGSSTSNTSQTTVLMWTRTQKPIRLTSITETQSDPAVRMVEVYKDKIHCIWDIWFSIATTSPSQKKQILTFKYSIETHKQGSSQLQVYWHTQSDEWMQVIELLSLKICLSKILLLFSITQLNHQSK